MTVAAPAARLAAEGVVIDCDGTLVATEELWGRAERRVTEHLGGIWSSDLKRQLVGRSTEASAAAIAAWCHVAESRVPEITRDLHATYAQLLARDPVLPKPGAVAMLDDLARRGIPVAVASNSTAAEVEMALARAGLIDHIVSIHVPSRALAPKPAPDVYLAACRALGVAPADAVAIEDSQAGLDAALAAGLIAVGVPSMPGEALAADLVVSSLGDLGVDRAPTASRTKEER